MLCTALALLSSLQIGIRIKGAIERALRQAVVIGVAAVVLIAGASFGLLAAYHALVFFFGITPLGVGDRGRCAHPAWASDPRYAASICAEVEVAGAQPDGLGR